MDKSSPRKNYLTSPIRIRKFTFPDKNGIVGSGGLAGGARGGGKGGGGLAAAGLSIVGGAVGVTGGVGMGVGVGEGGGGGMVGGRVGELGDSEMDTKVDAKQPLEVLARAQAQCPSLAPAASQGATSPPSPSPSPSSMVPHHLHLIRERTKQKVIEKARKGLREKNSPTVARSMSSHGIERSAAAEASSTAATSNDVRATSAPRTMVMSKPISLVKRIQQERRKSKFGDIDLDKMRQLASQRALEAQRETKARRDKEEKAREERRANKARERKKEQEEKDRRRAEIYAINSVMREAFNNRFRQFAGNMLAGGQGGHAVVSEEMEAELEGVRQGEVGGNVDFRGIGAV
ncbi:hypothetical protein TrRE_jg3763 [Triparma retinervis]|uniref:Uncharacterized protein n=1 Tax=Triparma retinervis TaxID=2557542 RepID=A0A9W6ZWK2_9STRA|nr:hypothetical protein TrRE_jg3763 [Triparma retinervis]